MNVQKNLLHQKNEQNAQQKYQIRYPNQTELDSFFSLVIIEPEQHELRLPLSLKPQYSDYFESILFIIFADNISESLIKDFQDYSCESNGLPKNVLILNKTEDFGYLSIILGVFIQKPNSKINILSTTSMFSKINMLSRTFQQSFLDKKICLYDPQTLPMIKEDEFLLQEQVYFSLNKEENMLLELTILKILNQINQLPTSITTLMLFVQSQVNEQAKTMQLEQLVNSEKITIVLLYEFVVNKVIIVSSAIYQTIVCRSFTRISEYEKYFFEVSFNTSILIPPQDEIKNEPLSQQEQLKGESDFLSLNTVKLLLLNQQLKPVPVKPDDSRIQKQNIRVNQASHTIQQQNQSCLQTEDISELNKTFVVSFVKSIVSTFLETFSKSNAINIKKPKSLIQSVINFTKNECTRRSKSSKTSEQEKKFSLEIQQSQSLQNLIVFNTFIILHTENCLRFFIDKDIQYNPEIIGILDKGKIDQIVKVPRLRFNLAQGDKFFNFPAQMIQELDIAPQVSTFSNNKNLNDKSEMSQSTHITEFGQSQKQFTTCQTSDSTSQKSQDYSQKFQTKLNVPQKTSYHQQYQQNIQQQKINQSIIESNKYQGDQLSQQTYGYGGSQQQRTQKYQKQPFSKKNKHDALDDIDFQ
ncbi:UNKNOWN [Stylonychia lemnae]|uniref:Uncharacterized protein n=1 Tax=Stylonychia lemnae TaxID=5949 RepID=A0A078B2F0_STYLE|nr:UNKNOWN [Stylonychia lemnae]|eukprot:CDW87658.1 UNKNOWN [Stylonychia lemnae]